MIILVGDTHAAFEWIPNILKDIPEDATIIQVGDFGFWPMHKDLWVRSWRKLGRKNPIYAIDGNHEYFPLFAGVTKPTEIWEGVIYVPRGTVMEIDGKTVGFMGGAESIDKIMRTPGRDWFMDEAITRDDMAKFDDVEHVDMLVTHTAPQSIITSYFRHPSLVFPHWRIPNDWIDPSAVYVQQLWEKFGKPPLFCGHFHESVTMFPGPVKILDINEVCEWRHE